jgi:tetratricopeptide (TPR) repeat protein
LSEFSRRDRTLFLIVILVALAVRIAYLVDISDSPYFENPVLDSFWYDDKAKSVIDGDMLARNGSFRVPLYIYFITGCYSLFGESLLPPMIIQAILGAVTCGLIFVIARRVFGTPAGVIAGLGFAFYRMAIYSDGEILPTTLFLLFIVGSVHFLLNALESERLRDAIVTGLFLGLAFLTRPDIVPLAILLVAAGLLVLGFRRGTRITLAFFGILLFFMVLLGIRNYAAFGEFFVLSPQGAVNLYIGNAGYSDGKTPLAPSTRLPYDIMADPADDSMILACRQAARESVGRDLSDRELSDYYIRRTIAEIKSDFPRWIGLMLRKTYYFLNSYEHSDIKLIPRFIGRHSTVLKLPLIGYAPVIGLGTLGFCLSFLRRNRLAWIIAAGVVAYTLNTILFFLVWRYRLPVVPFLIVFAGYAVSEIYQAARARSFRSMALMVIPVAALILVSSSRLLDIEQEKGASTYVMNEASLFARLGRLDEAIEAFKESIEIDPYNAKAYYQLGRVYADRGQVEESKKMVDEAVRLNPNYRPFADFTLGVAYVNRGDSEIAAKHFQKALDADPEFGLAAYNLGQCLAELDRYDEAEKAFTRAQYLCRDDTEALSGLAQGLVRIHRYEKGIRLAEEVLRTDPDNVRAMFTIGVALESQGKTDEALIHFQRALRYMPSSQEIRGKIRELRARGLER